LGDRRLKMELLDIIKNKLEFFTTDKFTFNEETHTYMYGKKTFVSVTTFIKNFVKEFDTEYQSRKKAIKILTEEGNELTEVNIKIYQNRLLTEWEDKKNVGCDLGSITHKTIEELLNNQPLTPILNDEASKRFLKFKKLYDSKIKDLIIPLGQEIRIFSEELQLAGTIDCLVLRKHNDGVWRLEIWDWKTNKKMNSDKDKCWNKLLAPFNSEWENEVNKYSIQLNLYKLILASNGIYVDGECVVVYIPPNDDEPQIIRCKDYIQKLEMYFGNNYYTRLKNKFVKNEK
jgi:hypothetical protein